MVCTKITTNNKTYTLRKKQKQSVANPRHESWSTHASSIKVVKQYRAHFLQTFKNNKIKIYSKNRDVIDWFSTLLLLSFSAVLRRKVLLWCGSWSCPSLFPLWGIRLPDLLNYLMCLILPITPPIEQVGPSDTISGAAQCTVCLLPSACLAERHWSVQVDCVWQLWLTCCSVENCHIRLSLLKEMSTMKTAV